MEKLKQMQISKILKDDEVYIVVRKPKGKNPSTMMYGTMPELYTLYSMLTKNLRKLKENDDDTLKEAFDLAFLSDEEVEKRTNEKIDKMIDELVEKIFSKKEETKKEKRNK